MKQVDLLDSPVLRSLTSLAVPIMATSLIQMAYNMTDMIWIGRVSADAVAAVGAAGMYLWFSNGIASISRLGGQVKTSHALGSGDAETAVRYASAAIQISFLLGAFCTIIFSLFSSPLIAFFRLNQESVVSDARIYLRIVSAGLLFSFLNQVLTGLFTALGMSGVTFRCTTVGLVANIVLDPVFIFGFFVVPPMGVAGAALATVLAQAVVFVMFAAAARHEVNLFPSVRLFRRLPPGCYRDIFRIGFFPALQNTIFSSLSMLIARLVAGYGDAAVAVQKVGGQIESISWMAADGFATATNVLIAQNFGANRKDRVRQAYRASMTLMMLWGVFTSCLLIFAPEWIFRIFIPEPDVLPMGVSYLRILGYSQLFSCMEITSAGAFQGLGKPMIPSVCGIVGNLARIPLALCLSATALGLNGVWWSISLSSIAKGIIVPIWFLLILRNYLKTHAQHALVS